MKRAPYNIKKRGGFSLVEVMLSVSIFVLLSTVLVGAYLYGKESNTLSGNRIRAALLAEEGLEVIKNIRDEDWANLEDGAYGLHLTEGVWSLNGVSDTQDIFTRQIQIRSLDEHRKEITSTVTWQQNPQRSGEVSISTLLSYWMEVVQNVIGNWSKPQSEGVADLAGGQDGVKVAVSGNYAYVLRQGSSRNFEVVDISDLQNPRSLNSLNLPNAVLNLAIESNYAYIASSNNTQEFIVVDISEPQSPQKISQYNLPGNQDATSVFVKNQKAYVVTSSSPQEEFFILDVSQPSSPKLLGAGQLNSSGNDIFVLDELAYVGTSGDELEVLDVSNPTKPTSIATLDLKGNADATAITGKTGVLYVGRTDGGIDTVDISNPNQPLSLNKTLTASRINDISLAEQANYLFAATDESKSEFQVLDMSYPGSLILLGTLDTPSDLNGIYYDPTIDRAIAVGADNSSELRIFKPSDDE